MSTPTRRRPSPPPPTDTLEDDTTDIPIREDAKPPDGPVLPAKKRADAFVRELVELFEKHGIWLFPSDDHYGTPAGHKLIDLHVAPDHDALFGWLQTNPAGGHATVNMAENEAIALAGYRAKR